MKKVISPLRKGDTGAEVVNLQDALYLMIDQGIIKPASPKLLPAWQQGLKAEQAGKTYGPITVAIVKQLQKKKGLRESGQVKKATAAAMNKFLKKRGLIGQPPQPETSAEYLVTGQILQSDASPLTGVQVRAFDKDLRHEQLLGKTVTDQEGRYSIAYQRAQFRRAEKQRADLLIRVYGAKEMLLLESSVIFNAKKEETVDLTLSADEANPIEKSEYEQYMEELKPVLEGLDPAELRAEDIVFLTGETDLNPQYIAFLSISHQLALVTDLPPELFYGLVRQRFPATLSPLLAFSAKQYRSALITARAENIIPASLQEKLDRLIEQLLRLVDQEEESEAGITRLRSDCLDGNILNVLAEKKSEYLNETLNESFRTRLAATLSKQGHPELAAFVQTMPALDLAASANKDLRGLLKKQIREAATPGTLLRDSLDTSVAALSTTTTVSDFLNLDSKVSSHPLFSTEAKRLQLCTRFDTIPGFTDRKVQRKLLDLYTEREGTVEEFWKKLRKEPEFQRPGLVDNIQHTLRLSALTRDSLPLVKSLQNLRQTEAMPSLRDLTRFDIDRWQALIREAAGDNLAKALPEAIPGVDEEERLVNYARIIHADLERAYPTEFIHRVITKAPSLDTDSIQSVLKLAPDLDPSQPLPVDLDLSSLEAPDQAIQAMEGLRHELNLFPETDYRTLLERPANRQRENLTRFFENAPDFSFGRTRIGEYLEEHSATAFSGIAEQDRPAVTAQLKRMQRLFHATPRSDQMHALLTEGFDSVSSIASVPRKTFMDLMTPRLGSEELADTILHNARYKVAVVEQGYFWAYQAYNDKQFFVMGPQWQWDLPEYNVDLPNLRKLFGSMDLCHCEHCQSLYSPAAYFVELLNFLDNRSYQVLIRRRPDLLNIRLNCDNAMTPMPYVDLVNEILEYLVASETKKVGFYAAHNTSGVSADELRANPQYVIPKAYEKLKNAVYPITLPFDLDVETARVYLGHLGSSLHEVMRLFIPIGSVCWQQRISSEKLMRNAWKLLRRNTKF
ncbi:MAG: hypothetical protein WGN25_20285 [Candidatus Electrothrix sp. GW3-4]|uniref:hypothetical protein n=1 Tax=Candidatus Electrothrix sp. GW3-4 TaxID=3126740 RepID=UPI0030D54209